MLRRGEALVRPGDIAVVRDPVLSDDTLTDTEGTCWKQSEGSSSCDKHVVPVIYWGTARGTTWREKLKQGWSACKSRTFARSSGPRVRNSRLHQQQYPGENCTWDNSAS